MMIAQLNKQTDGAGLGLRNYRTTARLVLSGLPVFAVATVSVVAQPVLATNTLSAPQLPDSTAAAFSVFRLLGALAIVMAIFFGGVWVFRNWQRTVIAKGQLPKLTILETKGLGQRHAIYVVGYEQQRLLIAASPAGVTMLATLPPAAVDGTMATPATKSNFSAVLRQVLQSKQ